MAGYSEVIRNKAADAGTGHISPGILRILLLHNENPQNILSRKVVCSDLEFGKMILIMVWRADLERMIKMWKTG